MVNDRAKGKGGRKPGYLLPNFRAIRLELGLDQAECAARIGVTRWTIIQWERYRMGVSRQRLEEITAALGVTTEDLFGKPLHPEEEPPRRPVPSPAEPPSWASGLPGPRGIPLPGLRSVRYQLRLGPLEFARRVGLSESTIGRLERGEGGAQRRTIRQIAVRLGIEPAELLEPPAEPPVSPWRRGEGG